MRAISARSSASRAPRTSGDKADCTAVPENAAIWSYVTSTRENCLGAQCPHYDACFVMEARRQALAADVVVVNHHLFFADLVLRDEGVAELLPASNTIIFDEAHQLPETASLFFGESVSTSQLIELARDTRLEGAASARTTTPRCRTAGQALDKAARDLRLAFAEESGRFPMRALEGRDGLRARAGERCSRGSTSWPPSCRSRRSAARASRGCWERALALAERGERWRSGADEERVRWVELFGRVAASQLDAAVDRGDLRAPDRGAMRAPGSSRRRRSRWTAISATTAARWGSTRGAHRELGQPLRFRGAMRCSTCRRACPSRTRREHTAAVVEAALPVIEAAGGGAFVLFTSLRAMREAHELLEAAFEQRGLDYPAARAGRGLALGDAGALPRPGQRRAGRQPLVLGGRGRARQRRCRWW